MLLPITCLKTIHRLQLMNFYLKSNIFLLIWDKFRLNVEENTPFLILLKLCFPKNGLLINRASAPFLKLFGWLIKGIWTFVFAIDTLINKQVQYLINVWIGQQIDYTFAFQLLIPHSSLSGHHLAQFMFEICKWVFVTRATYTGFCCMVSREGAGASHSSAARAWTLDSGGRTAAWWQGHS